jgi:hypothetical protein
MADPVELKEKRRISFGLMVWVCALLVVGTFTLTTIYNRFIFVEKEIQVISDRMDKRYSRLQDQIDELEVNKVSKPKE